MDVVDVDSDVDASPHDRGSGVMCFASASAPALPRERLELPRVRAGAKHKSLNQNLKQRQRCTREVRPGQKLQFPSIDQLEHLAEDLDVTRFRWAEAFHRNLQVRASHFAGSDARDFGEVSFFSEFSGSGCAEAAMMSVSKVLGCQEQLKLSYCADIDWHCRSVLQASCQGPIHCDAICRQT